MEGGEMNQIIVGIKTVDILWYDRVQSYIINHHNTELALEKIEESMEKKKFDVILVDQAMDFEKEEFTYGVMLYLTEELDTDQVEQTLCKYILADQFVKKLIHVVKGCERISGVEHIVVASDYETRLSKHLSLSYAHKMATKSKTCLLISLPGVDDTSNWSCTSVQDPFGHFIYYASESSEKLGHHLESLAFRLSESVMWIPKPNPFDALQWSKSIETNILDALEYQDDYDVVVWNLGNLFSLNFGHLFNRCSKFIWIRENQQPESDRTFEVFKELSACRLDLKTTIVSGSELDHPLMIDQLTFDKLCC